MGRPLMCCILLGYHIAALVDATIQLAYVSLQTLSPSRLMGIRFQRCLLSWSTPRTILWVKNEFTYLLKIIDQASNIMQLSPDLAKGLVTAIWKDPSWKMEKWAKKNARELLAPLSRHVRVDAVPLATVNHVWE